MCSSLNWQHKLRALCLCAQVLPKYGQVVVEGVNVKVRLGCLATGRL